jgi:hypothetical protein
MHVRERTKTLVHPRRASRGRCTVIWRWTYLNRAENPQNQCLKDDERCVADTKGEIDANVFADMRIGSGAAVHFGPVLEPETPTCSHSG